MNDEFDDSFYDDDDNIDDLDIEDDGDIEEFYDDCFDDEDDGYGFQSAGWGTDEDYGHLGEDY
jgi:hypothetical protein